MADKEVSAATLRIDELAASTSRAVFEAVGRVKLEQPDLVVNPRIWIGIWVDIQQNIPGKLTQGPGPG